MKRIWCGWQVFGESVERNRSNQNGEKEERKEETAIEGVK